MMKNLHNYSLLEDMERLLINYNGHPLYIFVVYPWTNIIVCSHM